MESTPAVSAGDRLRSHRTAVWSRATVSKRCLLEKKQKQIAGRRQRWRDAARVVFFSQGQEKVYTLESETHK